MSNFISCYDPKTEELNHYEVPYAVYIYVRQLEHCINYPDLSKLKKVYKERFKYE
jgi:hypothetical protein